MTKKELRVVAVIHYINTSFFEIKALAEKAQLKLLEEIDHHSDRYALPSNEAKRQVLISTRGSKVSRGFGRWFKEERYTSMAYPKYVPSKKSNLI